MKTDMPNKSYERGINHNYMILSKCNFFGSLDIGEKDYRMRMVLENNIKGLLPITYRKTDNETRFCYEINSLQSLERVLEKRELNSRELKSLFMGCIRLFETLEEYLLDGAQIILDCDFIYVDIEKINPYFVYYPDYECDVRQSFTQLVDKLLTRINHTDEAAVMIGYQIYRYTRNPNFVMGEIRRYMELPSEKSVPMEEKNIKVRYEEPLADGQYDYEETYKPKYAGDIIGGIICAVIALGILAFAAAIRIHSPLMSNTGRQASLYGAAVMAFVASGMFFIDGNKKRRLQKELNEQEVNGQESISLEKEKIIAIPQDNELKKRIEPPNGIIHRALNNENENFFYGETICLQESMAEERILRGQLNGREINVPLDKLPMTIGKLAGMSDYVIDDNTVSKMHTRFEEHDGKIYMYDLNSTNGTLKNGELIEINTPTQLDAGDKIKMGRVSLTYC